MKKCKSECQTLQCKHLSSFAVFAESHMIWQTCWVNSIHLTFQEIWKSLGMEKYLQSWHENFEGLYIKLICTKINIWGKQICFHRPNIFLRQEIQSSTITWYTQIGMSEYESKRYIIEDLQQQLNGYSKYEHEAKKMTWKEGEKKSIQRNCEGEWKRPDMAQWHTCVTWCHTIDVTHEISSDKTLTHLAPHLAPYCCCCLHLHHLCHCHRHHCCIPDPALHFSWPKSPSTREEAPVSE